MRNSPSNSEEKTTTEEKYRSWENTQPKLSWQQSLFFILLKSFFRINDNSVLKQRKREKERERKRDTLLFFHGSERGNKGGLMDIEVKNPAMTIVEVFTLLAGEQISCLRSQNWP